jgi:hypothetical protein
MVTMRRLVASFGAATALGLAMTGVTLAADPSEVDLSGTVDGNGQAQIDLDLLDERADAEADADAAAILDADADTDADADVAGDVRAALDGRAHARRAARAVAAADPEANAEADAAADVATDVDGATAVDDTSVTGFVGARRLHTARPARQDGSVPGWPRRVARAQAMPSSTVTHR